MIQFLGKVSSVFPRYIIMILNFPPEAFTCEYLFSEVSGGVDFAEKNNRVGKEIFNNVDVVKIVVHE